MNTKTASKQVFAQHLMTGDRAFGGVVTNRARTAMVNGSLVTRITVDLGENALPRFETFDRMALDIVSVD
jgi:hypothetical protein